MKKIITSIVICVFGLNILGQTITSTTPGEVQLNDVLPITISTDNGNFLQASTSTFVLTDGTQTLSPVSGTLTIVNDNLLWATFDFGAGWLYEGQLLNSQVSNDVDGVMFSADAVLITGPNTTVNFAESAITVDESAGTVTATVNISDAPVSATSVEVVLGTSTATNGLDFIYTSPTTVTFPAGSTASQTVTFTIIDDGDDELLENIVLNLENPTSGTLLGGNSSYTISITDNDVSPNPVITFDLASVTVNENVGTVTVNVAILSENGNATSVDVVLSSATATIGGDFTYTSPTTVTFPGGSSTAQAVFLGIIDDAIVEGDENIVLTLQNPTNGATIGSNATATIIITDNEPTSLVENSLESIVMFPNPTSNGSIAFKGINDPNIKIEISNIIGQVVHKNTLPTNGVINLTDVSKGTYIVTLFNESDRISKKLIIE